MRLRTDTCLAALASAFLAACGPSQPAEAPAPEPVAATVTRAPASPTPPVTSPVAPPTSSVPSTSPIPPVPPVPPAPPGFDVDVDVDIRKLRITDEGIFGPGISITEDGIFAPGIAISRDTLRLLDGDAAAELTGLKDRLKHLGREIRERLAKDGVAVEGGRMKIQGLDIPVGDIEIDIPDLVLEILGDKVHGDGAQPDPTRLDAASARTCDEGECQTNCPPGQTCRATCSGGGCRQTCGAKSTCDFTCSGGGCHQICEAGATCDLTCSGGECHQRAAESVSARMTCSGGGCRRACAPGATCQATCSGDDCSDGR